MVAREVRERHRVERHALHAPLIERVRRHLHRDAAHAGVDERAEHALELDRAGRREPAAALERRRRRCRQARRACRSTRCAPRRLVEQMAQHADRGRLAVRAGDADEMQLARGPAVRGRGRRGLRRAAPRCTTSAGSAVRDASSTTRSDGAGFRCGVEIVVAVALRAAHGDEQPARRHGAAVVGDPDDRRRQRAARARRAGRRVGERAVAIELEFDVRSVVVSSQSEPARRRRQLACRRRVAAVRAVPAAGELDAEARAVQRAHRVAQRAAAHVRARRAAAAARRRRTRRGQRHDERHRCRRWRRVVGVAAARCDAVARGVGRPCSPACATVARVRARASSRERAPRSTRACRGRAPRRAPRSPPQNRLRHRRRRLRGEDRALRRCELHDDDVLRIVARKEPTKFGIVAAARVVAVHRARAACPSCRRADSCRAPPRAPCPSSTTSSSMSRTLSRPSREITRAARRARLCR